MPAVVPVAGDRWVRFFSRLVPGELRPHFLAALLQDRREMVERGTKPWRVNLDSVREILAGIVQRAPLRSLGQRGGTAQPPVVEWAAIAGWPMWRIAGPAMFLGHVAGSGALFWVGAILLLAAIAGLVSVVALGREPLPDLHARYTNAVLGGTFALLVLVLLFGAVTVTLLLLSRALGLGVLASLAVHAHAFFATGCACAITASGWVPEEWYPRRLAVTRAKAAAAPAVEPEAPPEAPPPTPPKDAVESAPRARSAVRA